jgi:hypothetical protein
MLLNNEKNAQLNLPGIYPQNKKRVIAVPSPGGEG